MFVGYTLEHIIIHVAAGFSLLFDISSSCWITLVDISREWLCQHTHTHTASISSYINITFFSSCLLSKNILTNPFEMLLNFVSNE